MSCMKKHLYVQRTNLWGHDAVQNPILHVCGEAMHVQSNNPIGTWCTWL